MARHDDSLRLRHMLDYARVARRLSNGRERVDLNLLWSIVQDDLPSLISQLNEGMTADD